MSLFVAIDVRADTVQLVSGETSAEGTIQILQVRELSRAEIPAETSVELNAGANGGTEFTGTPPTSDSPEGTPSDTFSGKENGESEDASSRFDLEELFDLEIDETFGVIPSHHILFERVNLPFSDQRKIDKVLPLQVQDLIPFDVQGFIIDAVSLGNEEEGYDFIASLIPREEVEQTLELCSRIGANPKKLSCRASAMASLPRICPEYLTGSFGLISASDRQCSIALFVDGKLVHLRELPIHDAEHSLLDFENLCRDVRCSIAGIERSLNKRIDKLFMVGSHPVIRKLSRVIGRPAEPLDLSGFVMKDPSVPGSVNDLAWAIGLFADELPASSNGVARLVNYRQGNLAYKPTWGNLIGAFKEEWYNFALLGLIFFGWLLYSVVSAHSRLSRIEDAIEREIAQVLPGAEIPDQQEANFVRIKVEQMEEELRGLGSLSKLSPLDSLKEIHEAIPQDIDIEINSINIKYSGLELSGSVLSNVMVGRLQEALEARKGRFCNVKADSKDKIPGSMRVSFFAEVPFCD